MLLFSLFILAIVFFVLKMRAEDSEAYSQTENDIIAAAQSDDPILKRRWAAAFGNHNDWKSPTSRS